MEAICDSQKITQIIWIFMKCWRDWPFPSILGKENLLGPSLFLRWATHGVVFFYLWSVSHWVTATANWTQQVTFETWDHSDVCSEWCMDKKRDKDQNESFILWCQGSFALLRCFIHKSALCRIVKNHPTLVLVKTLACMYETEVREFRFKCFFIKFVC